MMIRHYKIHLAGIRTARPPLINKYVVSSETKIQKNEKTLSQQKKELNYNKKCIKLILQPPKQKLSLSYLIETHQNSFFMYLKLFSQQRAPLSIIQFTSVTMDFDYHSFHQRQISSKLLRKIKRILKNQEDFNFAQFYEKNNLQNFIKIIFMLQNSENKEVLKIGLIFLNFLMQNDENLPLNKFYKIVSYLSSKYYFSQTVLNHLKTLQFTKNFLTNSIQTDSNQEIIKNFQVVSNMLQTLMNLQKWGKRLKKQKNSKQEKQKIFFLPNYRSLKSTLIDSLFMLLSNPITAPLIISKVEPSQIFLIDLFPSNKQQYYKIIKYLLSSNVVMNTRMHQDLFPAIFDMLYFCTQYNVDQLEIKKILNLYNNNILFFINGSSDQLWGGKSLILLCKKFQYFPQQLTKYIINCVLQQQTKLKNSIKQFKFNEINFQKTILMLKCYQIGIILQNINDKKYDQSNSLIQKLNDHFEHFMKKIKTESHLELINYFSCPFFFKQDEEEIQDKFKISNNLIIQQFQKKLKIQTTIFDSIEKQVSPNCFSYNVGAKIKLFIWNTYFYSFTTKNLTILQQICQFIYRNEKFRIMIQSYISYPGLLEGLLYLDQSFQNRKLFDSSQSLLKQFIQKQNIVLINAFEKQLQLINQQQLSLSSQYFTNIEFLQNPSKIRFSLFKNSTYLVQVLKHQFISQRYMKNEKIINKIIEQIQIISNSPTKKIKNALLFYMNFYPFIPDVLITLEKQYRGKQIVIIINNKIQQNYLFLNNQNYKSIPTLTQQCIRYFVNKKFYVVVVNHQSQINMEKTIEEIIKGNKLIKNN